MTFCLNLRKFLQVCCNLRTFVAVPENLRFTHLGAKKTVNLGFRAKKTEFPAMPLTIRIITRTIGVLARMARAPL